MTQHLLSFPLFTLFAVLLLLFGALLVAYAVGSRRRTISARLSALVRGGILPDHIRVEPENDKGGTDGRSTLPEEKIVTIRWLLARNGLAHVRPDFAFLPARILSAVAAALLGVVVFLLLGSAREDLASLELVGLLFAPFGWYAPTYLLNSAVKRHHRDVTAALPDVLELALICIDSGMGLEAALRRVQIEIAGTRAAMADELSRTINDISVTGDLQTALKRLANRIPTKEMRTISSIFSQSLQYGSPLSVTFKTVIDVTRKSQMLALEERASKFPALIMLPGLIFVFPNFLLIMMGPPVLELIKSLS